MDTPGHFVWVWDSGTMMTLTNVSPIKGYQGWLGMHGMSRDWVCCICSAWRRARKDVSSNLQLPNAGCRVLMELGSCQSIQS